MITIGKTQKLIIVKEKPQGAYLGESAEARADETVLLPAKEVPAGASVGDALEVFIYRDSSDRLIATSGRPLLEAGGLAALKVREVTGIGAFLDFGLPKDLLLPYAEQTAKLKAGDEVLVTLYVDKSGRLAASMKIYPYLRTDSPYIPGAMVQGRVYQVAAGHGAYVAVDDCFSGMIPERELPPDIKVLTVTQMRVTAVKPDGKLDLSVRGKAYEQMEEDAALVWERIAEDFGGELPYDDHASPEKLREDFGLSKAAFKRAVGRLYKERRVELRDGHIRTL